MSGIFQDYFLYLFCVAHPSLYFVEMVAVDDVGDMRENISGSSISGVGQFGVPNLISSSVIFRSKKKSIIL